jgi:class 3 adenylate cyclase
LELCEASQVFTLLETVYQRLMRSPNAVAYSKSKRLATVMLRHGLPDPRKDHAVVMARFSRDALNKMNDLTKTRSVSVLIRIYHGTGLWPCDLQCLTRDKSRFQLFGDTVNTAARIEEQRNKIHLSKETADLLIAAGRSHWVSARKNWFKPRVRRHADLLAQHENPVRRFIIRDTDSSADNDDGNSALT